MPYYPLSQVKINLYTNGGEFIKIIDNESYVGFYWQTSSGKFFTGKTPNDPYSTEIIRPTTFPEENLDNPDLSQIAMEASVENYSVVANTFTPTEYPKYDSSLSRAKPLYVPPLITDQDYKQGYITRYFCKKTNEFLYLEINKDTYDKLLNKDIKILYQLYKPFKMKWQLVGDKEKVYNTNKNIVHLVIRDQQMYNFNQYLKENYTQFWKPIFSTLTENLYTDGNDFKSENGQDYIGYYHYHPVKGFMMGATHTSTPHNYIFYKKPLGITPVINNSSNKVESSNTPPNNMGTSGGGGY